MLIKKRDADGFLVAAQQGLGDKSFNIQTQYKVLKLKKAIEEEKLIVDQMLNQIIDDYCVRDENDQPVFTKNGGYKFKDEDLLEIEKKLNEINNTEIQLPDLYFSLDELDGLGLTLDELNCFMSFIK